MLSLKRLQIPINGEIVSRRTIYVFTESTTFDGLFALGELYVIAGGQGHGGNVNAGGTPYVSGERGSAGERFSTIVSTYVKGEIDITVGGPGNNGLLKVHPGGFVLTEADAGDPGEQSKFESDAYTRTASGVWTSNAGEGAWFNGTSGETTSSHTYQPARTNLTDYGKGGWQRLVGTTHQSEDAGPGAVTAEVRD